MKGYFLALEGPDGSGKSTAANLIKLDLEKRGIETILTREPGGTDIGEQIRKILLSKENSEMGNITEALLYAASRAQHVEEKIRPLVEAGKVVISDRYVFSSLAYQGFSRNLGIEKIMEINKFAMNGLYPDRILFFDIDPIEALNRKFIDREGDRLEIAGEQFHRKVFQGYKKAIELFPEKVKIIDGRLSPDEVYRQCMDIIEEDLYEINNSNSTR